MVNRTNTYLDIFFTRQFLFLVEIKAGCEEFLKSQLDPQNCLGIRQFAELHGCSNLKNATQEYIYEHFSQVVQNNDEFSNLKPKELEDLIKSDEIVVANEEIVYNCVFNWINFDKKNREQHLPTLMAHIRMPLLSPQFLTDVCDKELLIKQSFECRDILDEAKRYYLRPDCRFEMSGDRFRIRTGKDEYLVMLGGFGSQQKPLEVVEKYCPRTNTWTNLTVSNYPHFYATSLIKGSVFKPLTKRRRYAASAAIGKCIYVIGGYDTKARLKSVEKLDLTEAHPQWQSVSPLLFRRALPAVCVHDSKRVKHSSADII